MDFFIIANAWSAGKDNPTSKHRIALELIRRGHRILWIEGSGMRTPSMGSSHDRLRMLRKVGAAFRGVRVEEIRIQNPESRPPYSAEPMQNHGSEAAIQKWDEDESIRSRDLPLINVLSPLFIPLPKYEFIRRFNGLICRWCMRYWGWRLGFRDPVLINYVPVLAEAMRGWQRQTTDCRPQTTDYRLQTTDRRHQTSDQCAVQAATATLNKNQSEAHPSSKSDVYGMPAVALAKEGLKSKVSPRAVRVVYHCVDRWDAFSTYDSRLMTAMDRRCCELADVVLATSQDLVTRCRRYSNNVHYLSHGVDHAHFAEALQVRERPADLPAGRVAGFFGLLSEWLDQDLLIGVAKAVPECQLVLIGKADVDISRLKGIANVHILGPRSFNQLPAYVAHFDVGLIPFVINELTVAVNPIKLREMLSAGCPVVSTSLPEVEEYKGRGVMVAGTKELFIGAVSHLVRKSVPPAERTLISDGIANETWTAKVDVMLSLLATHP